ncbi:uncharacterized protein [Aristolochia californica]|uniref:uncharacterized protein n=1 Tax=Aristolochia californica TaxID=171875 RepID=UPI0035DF35E2
MASEQIRALHAVLATLLLLGHFSCLAESRLHTHLPSRGRKLSRRKSALAPPAPVGSTNHRRDDIPGCPPDYGEEEPSNLEPELEPEPDEGDPPETSCDDEQEPAPDMSSEDTPWVEGPEPEPEADETPDSGDAGNMPREDLN